MDMKKLRFGIVGGAAGIASTHRDAIRKNPDCCELVGLTDVAADRCREIASKENARFFVTYDEMLGSPDINAIAICTPHPFHCDLALKALKANKHVLTEKPLCVTASEADQMIAAAKKSRAKLGVVFQTRFRPDLKKAKELLTNGTVGALYRTTMVVAWYRTQAYYNSGGWRATWRGEGGGVLLNQAPHFLDLFTWLGGMPKKVYAWTPTLKHKIEVEDCASALLEYENGAQGFLHTSTIQAPNQERFEFCGENGRLVVENGLTFEKISPALSDHIQNSHEIWSKPKVETQRFEFPQTDATHFSVYGEFARRVLAGKEPPVNVIEGRNSVELANALILSHYTKKPVSLPLYRAKYDKLLRSLIRKSKRKI